MGLPEDISLGEDIVASVHPETAYFEAERFLKKVLLPCAADGWPEQITFVYKENHKKQKITVFGRRYPAFFKFFSKKKLRLAPTSSEPWSRDWPLQQRPAHNI